MTAPPRMCAVAGKLNSASVGPLCGVPPMRWASHCAARLAAGMNVGLGFAASCSVVIRTPPPKRRGRGLNRSALSTVCITSTISVRRDQLGVTSRRPKRTG